MRLLSARGPGSGPSARACPRRWPASRGPSGPRAAVRGARLDLPARRRRSPGGPGVVEALHVNYGLRPEAADDERWCAALCERLGVALTRRTGAGARRSGQPPGLGSRRPLRRRCPPCPAPRRARRRRPHGHRPGRDDPAPARRLAGAASPAGHAGPRRTARAPAARPRTRGDRGVLPGPRPGLARRRLQRAGLVLVLYARAREARDAARASRGPSGGRGQPRAHGGAAARRGRRARGARRRGARGSRPDRDRPPGRPATGPAPARGAAARRGRRGAAGPRGRGPRRRAGGAGRRREARRRSISAADCGRWSSTACCASTRGVASPRRRRSSWRCPEPCASAAGTCAASRRPPSPWRACSTRLPWPEA